MAKLKEYQNSNGRLFVFFCPGCKYDHPFHVGSVGRPSWEWNGSMESPTFSPSLLVFRDLPEKRCHSFVCLGKIQFLDDCFHELKNQTVEIPEYED